MTYSSLWLSVNALILDIVLLTLFYEQKASDLHHRRMFLAVLLNLLTLNLIGFIYTLILMTIGEAAISDFLISWLASLVISLVPMLFLGYLNSVFYYDAAQKRANGILTTFDPAAARQRAAAGMYSGMPVSWRWLCTGLFVEEVDCQTASVGTARHLCGVCAVT